MARAWRAFPVPQGWQGSCAHADAWGRRRQAAQRSQAGWGYAFGPRILEQ
eukprot:gene19081-biopygen16024